MEQTERLDFLLRYLLAELPAHGRPEIPAAHAERRALFRALVNIRAPGAVSKEFLAVQDAFLQKEAQQKGTVPLESIPPCGPDPRIALWQGDITRLAVDAIVNAANSGLLGCFAPGHHCIDNAIHTAAGVQLREACHALMLRQGQAEKPGQAKVTPGYNLPARHVIHTVGPQTHGKPTEQQKSQLADCYRACLDAAVRLHMPSLAFCCISTGVFGFPNGAAAQIAVETVRSRLEHEKHIERVIFNVFLETDWEIYQTLLTGSTP